LSTPASEGRLGPLERPAATDDFDIVPLPQTGRRASLLRRNPMAAQIGARFKRFLALQKVNAMHENRGYCSSQF
jgi:hypothetical protein